MPLKIAAGAWRVSKHLNLESEPRTRVEHPHHGRREERKPGSERKRDPAVDVHGRAGVNIAARL